MALVWERQLTEAGGGTYGDLQYEDDSTSPNYLRIYAVRYQNLDPTRRYAVRVIQVPGDSNSLTEPTEIFYAEILPNTQETTFTFPKNKRPLYEDLNFQGWFID